MEERLKELKEKITSFANDYDIKDFSVYINRQETIHNNGEKKSIVESVDLQLEV